MTHAASQPSARRRFARWLPAAILLAATAASGVIAQDLTLPGKPDSVKFAVMSDLHGRGDQAEYGIARQMAAVHAKFPFEMVLMGGDNISWGHTPRDLVEKFERPFGPLLNAGVQFYAALGNHDDQTFRSYNHWNMRGERYYTFNRNDVQFFVLDTNRVDPPQVAWIADALEHSHARWKICCFHHPLYSDGGTHGSQTGVRSVLEPIFATHGVNVVFSGHDHIYERIRPQKGITYFVTGSAGGVRTGDITPSPMTAASADQEQSFMVVEIDGDTLYFEAISRTGKRLDSDVIHR
jgi:3',5'-cyclic AMP phosphodiesterase CpdA